MRDSVGRHGLGHAFGVPRLTYLQTIRGMVVPAVGRPLIGNRTAPDPDGPQRTLCARSVRADAYPRYAGRRLSSP
jgi:hypothetical protein